MSVTRPVKLDRGTGITRNISMSGICFETDVGYVPGNLIIFFFKLTATTEKKLMLGYRGMIVRVERRDGKVGVAAKIVGSKIESRV